MNTSVTSQLVQAVSQLWGEEEEVTQHLERHVWDASAWAVEHARPGLSLPLSASRQQLFF